MNIVVDTSIWSLALRRKSKPAHAAIELLRELIKEGRVVLLGVIRQEVLSGIRHCEQFEKLKDYLRAFPDLPLGVEDYELAAEYFNACRSHGIQGSNTDFLICAAAARREYQVLTVDKDFGAFIKYLPIKLIQIMGT